ncbi:hypothetical protein [Vibrio phage J14]|nr:hypothetical protein [Vibrio phage J14]
MSKQNETVDAPEDTNLNVQVTKGETPTQYDSLISNSEHKGQTGRIPKRAN